MNGVRKGIAAAGLIAVLSAGAFASGNLKPQEPVKNHITSYSLRQEPKTEQIINSPILSKKRPSSDSLILRLIAFESDVFPDITNDQIFAVQSAYSAIAARIDSNIEKHRRPESLPLPKLCRKISKQIWDNFTPKEGCLLFTGIAAKKKMLDPANSCYLLAGFLGHYGVKSKLISLPGGFIALRCTSANDTVYLETNKKGRLKVHETYQAFRRRHPVDYGQYGVDCPNPLEYIARGNYEYLHKSYRAAINDFSAVLDSTSARSAPRILTAWYNRGTAYLSDEDDSLAARDFGRLIKLDSNNTDYLDKEAYADAQIKRYQDAIRYYSDILRRSPKDAVTYSNRAAAEYFVGKYKESVEDFDRAVELGNPDPYIPDKRKESERMLSMQQEEKRKADAEKNNENEKNEKKKN